MSGAVPVLKSDLLAAIILGAATLNGNLTCEAIASDYQDFRQGLCGDLMYL